MTGTPHRSAILTPTALVVIALLGGWTAASTLQPRQAPPPAPPPPVSTTQYGLLTHHSQGALYPNLGGKWYFEDITGRYEPPLMAQHFGLKPGDENLPPRILSAIAAQGWELVTHTDAAVCIPPEIRDGTSTWSREEIRRTEQWWFKKK